MLESGCHKDCDWTEFEPVALLVCLTELLQECAIFWDGDEEMSGLTKITVKGLVVDCLRQMNKILQDGTMVSSGNIALTLSFLSFWSTLPSLSLVRTIV